MSALAIELVYKGPCRAKDLSLSAIYTNTSRQPLALAFWWNRQMRVLDANDTLVTPGPGPVLPCGVAETWHMLMPGRSHHRTEPIQCTQPAGRTESIGWSYKLTRGVWRITLVFEAPPTHGFSQSESNEYAFRGRVESQELVVELI